VKYCSHHAFFILRARAEVTRSPGPQKICSRVRGMQWKVSDAR